MASRQFLELSNPEKLIRCLTDVIEPEGVDQIRVEIASHVEELLRLSRNHIQLARAVRARPSYWRHTVSRSYYGAYVASKAIRYAVTGQYSQEAEDHKRIGNLPDDFPYSSKWSAFLQKFRADRNVADYDHLAQVTTIETTPTEYLLRSEEFIALTITYLKGRGFPV